MLAARIAAVGADEDLDALTRELATDGGLRVAFAVAPDGRDVGMLRMVHGREATELRRLAVVPAWEAHGVAWMLDKPKITGAPTTWKTKIQAWVKTLGAAG